MSELQSAKDKYGRVGLWVGVLDAHPTAVANEAAQYVESLGFQTMWIPEAVGRDAMVASANYLAATTKLNIATGIANIYARDPMTMNSSYRTLSESSGDRFLLGLGVSHGHLVAGIRKHDYSKPYSAMVDYLDRMDKSLFMAVGPEKTPLRVLAALGPKMLELSAEKAQGAHPYFTTPEHTQYAREKMGAEAMLMPEQMVVLETAQRRPVRSPARE